MPGKMAQADIESLYFGLPTNALFGCYHAPRVLPRRDCGVVCCYPLGHEYIASHRAFRQLATQLARVGFPVLRFDYYGCGDSGGDGEQGQLRQWRSDIAQAINEIRARSGVRQLCLVGLRLGATLAMMVGAERGDIARMVLWDPVLRGSAYLEELTALHAASVPYSCANTLTEILGFPLPEALLTELTPLDLCTIRQKPAHDILLIDTSAGVGDQQFREHLHNLDVRVAHQHFPGLQLWAEDPDKALVPTRLLQALVSWLSESCL